MNELAKLTSVLWMEQDPVLESNLAARRKMITNEWITLYNQAAEMVFCNGPVRLWQSARQLAVAMNASTDGLHVAAPVVAAQAQLLMNFFCNRFFHDGLRNLSCSAGSDPEPTGIALRED